MLRDIERMTRLSHQPVTRLVRPYRKDGKLSNRYRTPKQSFTRRFTATDVAVLAEWIAAWPRVQPRHQEVNGPDFLYVRRGAPRATGGNIGFPSVQPAGRQAVPEHAANWRPHLPAPRPRPNGVPGYIRIGSVY